MEEAAPPRLHSSRAALTSCKGLNGNTCECTTVPLISCTSGPLPALSDAIRGSSTERSKNNKLRYSVLVRLESHEKIHTKVSQNQVHSCSRLNRDSESDVTEVSIFYFDAQYPFFTPSRLTAHAVESQRLRASIIHERKPKADSQRIV